MKIKYNLILPQQEVVEEVVATIPVTTEVEAVVEEEEVVEEVVEVVVAHWVTRHVPQKLSPYHTFKRSWNLRRVRTSGWDRLLNRWTWQKKVSGVRCLSLVLKGDFAELENSSLYSWEWTPREIPRETSGDLWALINGARIDVSSPWAREAMPQTREKKLTLLWL